MDHKSPARATELSRIHARPLVLRPRLTAGLPLSRDPVLLGCPFAPPIGPDGRSSEPEFAWMDECSVRRECTPGTPAAVRRRTEPARVGNSAVSYARKSAGGPPGEAAEGSTHAVSAAKPALSYDFEQFNPGPPDRLRRGLTDREFSQPRSVTSPDRVAAASRLGTDGGSVPSPSPFLSSAGSDGRGS